MAAQSQAVAAAQGAPSEQVDGIAQLLARVKQRDRCALRTLYLAYARRVHSYAVQVLRDEHAAEDVVHDVFIRVWRYAPSYDGHKGSKPEAWLFQIARNVAINEAVHRSRMVQADGDDVAAPAADEGGFDPAARLADLASSRGEVFTRALQALPSHCRQVLHLRFHHGMSNPEIARHLGVPLGTAKTWLRRGLLQMRGSLKVTVAQERQEEWT